MRDANRPAVGVSAVVVDVGVEAGAVFDVVEVTNEHLIDHICDALSHVVQEWTEHMFVRYERRRTECPIFLQFFVQPRKSFSCSPVAAAAPIGSAERGPDVALGRDPFGDSRGEVGRAG